MKKMTRSHTCNGTLLDPVTNWRNFALSVWSKLRRARQNLKRQIMQHYCADIGGNTEDRATHQTIWRLVTLYLWYSVLAFKSSMLMSGKPESNSSNSCSLKIAISLKRR